MVVVSSVYIDLDFIVSSSSEYEVVQADLYSPTEKSINVIIFQEYTPFHTHSNVSLSYVSA